MKVGEATANFLAQDRASGDSHRPGLLLFCPRSSPNINLYAEPTGPMTSSVERKIPS